MKYTYTDVTKKMCAVCGKPHGPGKKFCPGSVRSSRLLIPVKNGAEEMLMTSDEVCRRCRHSFAKKDGLCEECREEMERSKAMSRDEGKGGASAAPYAEGEERYRSVPPKDDLSNYEPLSADTKENIMRCLTCEIPVEYCKGGGCVIAYRTWRADVNSCQKRRKNARGHKERPE